MKTTLYIALIMSLVVGPVFGSQRGVFGDSPEVSNVLMLQQIVARSLSSQEVRLCAAQVDRGDVVNVLDYQKLVYAAISQIESPEDDAETVPFSTEPATVSRGWSKPIFQPIAFLSASLLQRDESAIVYLNKETDLPRSQLRLNLFSLYPHAPPH